ncbi:DUF948 domain-containing protein [Alkalicoccus daliensis]|uniref:Uncharacterized protein YoxC, contains an MCP-like domain n=1 Tax=Alkalicoccus daliensis TaxID=745820 RepID=A0A1H0EBT7_9BACI|nr:DUF948 domain-containing protein [Alkalicoccus daliensis]SDN79927.1 Uncharacterized protein YoxC, contains an MCP-like domain [Alkalicoccus daliensis]
MDWLGIGVFILAIAIFVGVLLLIPVLKKLTDTLGNTADTVSTLNKSLGEITSETTLILYNTNETLVDVNDKIGKLNPLFDIIHDTGEAAHHLTGTLASYTSVKHDRAESGISFIDRKNLEGIMRGAAFIYYLRQVKKESDRVSQPRETVTSNHDQPVEGSPSQPV